MKIDERRKDHGLFSLREEDLDPDPIRQFRSWFDEAALGEIPEVNAMALATATPDGRPSVRIVYLRGIDERGFTFFTNYESRKARELEANPHAALVFFWQELERQVRIEGRVERASDEESDRYFHGRPAGSRLGAWASPQSRVIGGARPSRPCTPRSRPVTPTARSPGPTTGVVIAWSPKPSSSGKAGPAGCTTGCVIRAGTMADGSSSGWPRDRAGVAPVSEFVRESD